MAGILKRIIAVLVSIVWLSLILALLAGFFAPDLHQLLPEPVRDFTNPQVLRERWQSFTDSLVSGIGVQPPSEPAPTETPTPDAEQSTAPTSTPVPETPTATPPPLPSPTPTTEQAMSSDGDDETPVLEPSVSVSVTEAGQADLRSAPSEEADIIGLVAEGGSVNVNGRDPTGNWYRLEDGTWINADDLVEVPLDQVPIVDVEIQLPPEESQEPLTPSDEEADTPTPELVPVPAAVNADSNLRAGPGVEYDRVGGINFGEEASIVGISTDGEWYLLEGGAWLFAALVAEAIDVPVVKEDGQLDQMDAAGTEQQETGQAGTDEQQGATEQTQEDTEQTGAEQPETDDQQTATETEQTEADAEQPQPVVIAPLGANLRAGPGVEFERVDGAEEGKVLTIVAQDETGAWLQLEDGSWISAALVANVPADLPVASAEATEDEQDAQPDDVEQDPQTDEDEQDPQTDEDDQDAQTGEDEQTEEDEQDTLEEITPVLFATVNTDANLRDGPGLDATIVDFAPAGTQLTIVDRSDDEEWLQLDNGSWILAALADILPAEGEEETDDNAGTETDDEGRVAQPQVWTASPMIL